MKIREALEVRPDGILIAGWVMILLLLLAHGSGWSQELGDLGGDSAEYVLLARSLAGGFGYRDLYLAGGPAHTQYPFGWPLLLVPCQWLPGQGFGAEHGLVLVLAAAALGLAFHWTRAEAGRRSAWLALGLLGFAPVMVEASGQLRSEIPCLVFGMLTLLALPRYAAADRWKDRRLATAALLAAATTLVRSAGIAFLLGGALYLIARRDHRDRFMKSCAFLVLGALPVGTWMLRNRLVGETGSSYFDQLLLAELYTHDAGRLDLFGLVERVTGNVATYVKLIGWTIFAPVARLAPGGAFWLGIPAIAAAVGFLVRLWQRRGAAEWILPIYLTVILIWPWTGPRFLIPILPMVVLYAIEGLRWPVARLARSGSLMPRWARAAFAVVGLVAVAGNALESRFLVGPRFDRADVSHGERLRIDFAGYSEYALWKRRGMASAAQQVWGRYLVLGEIALLRGGGRVMCRKPRLTALLNGVPTTGIPLEDDRRRFLAEIERAGARFVLLDELGGLSARYLRPTIESHPHRFDPVEQIGGSVLYEVRHVIAASPK